MFRFIFLTPPQFTATLADELKRTTYSLRPLSNAEAAALKECFDELAKFITSEDCDLAGFASNASAAGKALSGVSNFDAILAACARHGVVPGIHANEELAAMWIERGFRLVTVGYDQFSVLDGLRGALDASRGSAPSGQRPGASTSAADKSGNGGAPRYSAQERTWNSRHDGIE